MATPIIANYATLNVLAERAQAASTTGLVKAAASREYAYRNCFLSHSSQDVNQLPGAIALLTNHGGRVYIDKGDPRLPQSTSPETARILRDTVRQLPRFVLLVSESSKDSSWIPWELGLADGHKNSWAAKVPSDVALLPTALNNTHPTWAEQEYLGLYRRIVFGKHADYPQEIWMVWDQHANTATALSDWLSVPGVTLTT